MIWTIFLFLTLAAIVGSVLFASGPAIIEGILDTIEGYREVFHRIRKWRNQE